MGHYYYHPPSAPSQPVLRRPPRCLYDILHLRQHVVLKLRAIGQQHILRRHAHDRAIQGADAFLGDHRGEPAPYGRPALKHILLKSDDLARRLLDGDMLALLPATSFRG